MFANKTNKVPPQVLKDALSKLNDRPEKHRSGCHETIRLRQAYRLVRKVGDTKWHLMTHNQYDKWIK